MITKSEKTGKISSIEEVVAANGNELWRVIVNTAEKVDISKLSELSDLTSFMLSVNERTEFSVLMPRIEGITTEQITNVMVNKTVDIVIFKSTLKDLSNNKIERVKYTNSRGEEKITSTMSRTYIKGSQNADDKVAFDAMKTELLERLNGGDFTPFKEEDATKQQQQQNAKPNYSFQVTIKREGEEQYPSRSFLFFFTVL